MPEDVRNAVVAGVLAWLLAFAVLFRWSHRYLPFLFLGCCAVLRYLHMLDRSWALESLKMDADWAVGLPLVGWMIVSGLGLVRLSGWPLTVAIAAVLGDRFAAIGLVSGEADPARRARLVLAASGASLLGLTGGPAVLVLGWGGWRTVALALVLAGVGWVGAPVASMVREAGKPATAVLAGVAGAMAVLAAWMLMVGGTAEYLALAVERLPLLLPRAWRMALAGFAVLMGGVGDEGAGAMVLRAAFDRSLEVMTRVPLDVMRAGLAVGGGLPLLFLTGSRLRTGLPLWCVQVAIVLVWAQWFVT